MIKSIIFTVLLLGALADSGFEGKKARLIFNNELLLPSFLSTDVTGDILIKVQSIDNSATTPIKVDLMEISDLASPLTSATSLASQDCTIVSSKCLVTFFAPKLDSAKKYAIRFTDQTTTRQISVKLRFWITSAAGIKRSKENETRLFLTPEGPTKPGFKFYAAAGTWSANFKFSSTPAPTVDQWVFKLWSVNGNTWNFESVQTISSGNFVSFAIGTAGYYILTVGIKVSAIDASTKYPLSVDFQFGAKVCPSGQYFDKTAVACALCSNIANSTGNTTFSGICDCNTGFFWNRGTSICQACVGKCPKKLSFEDDQSIGDEPKYPIGQDIKKIMQDFNNGNLKKN